MRSRFNVKIVVICKMVNSWQRGASLEILNLGVNSFELACCK